MLGWTAKRLGDPGWKLRCIDPPIAWLHLEHGQPTEVGIRIQLTCYLLSRRAQPVRIRETRLLLAIEGQEVVAPSTGVTDVGGGRFPEPPGHSITGHDSEHALCDFATTDPGAVQLLREPGEPIAATVEALVNDSSIYRRLAQFDLIRTTTLSMDSDWTQISTGR